MWSSRRLNGWWPFTINLHLVNFASHSPRGSEDISFFISHVTSCGHVTKGSSLPSVVAIRLLEVETWPTLIFNVRRRIHMIILLQSVTIQIRSLFWHISYCKVQQSNFITKFDRLLLQNAPDITKCDRIYYKVRQVLQSATVITKWGVTPLHGMRNEGICKTVNISMNSLSPKITHPNLHLLLCCYKSIKEYISTSSFSSSP